LKLDKTKVNDSMQNSVEHRKIAKKLIFGKRH